MPRPFLCGFLLFALATTLSGCRDFLGKGDCAPIGRFALDIHVRDAVSGLPLSGTTVILGGAEQDTVAITDDHFVGGHSAGGYTVTIRRTGYRDFTRKEIFVGLRECDEIKTVALTVDLQPAN